MLVLTVRSSSLNKMVGKYTYAVMIDVVHTQLRRQFTEPASRGVSRGSGTDSQKQQGCANDEYRRVNIAAFNRATLALLQSSKLSVEGSSIQAEAARYVVMRFRRFSLHPALSPLFRGQFN